jgi:hypothetical protein
LQSLLSTLEEQAVFAFTGKVNVIKSENRQFLGEITQKDGLIVGASYKGLNSKKALYTALIDDVDSGGMNFIVEPELIEEERVVFEISVEELKQQAREKFEHYQRSKKLRPPDGVRLLVDPDFVVEGADVTSDEFEVLAGLTDYNKVGDIYKNVNLLEYEITNALVSLRMKKALRVFR